MDMTRSGDGRRNGRFPDLWIDVCCLSSQSAKGTSVTFTGGRKLPTYSCGYSSGFSPDSLLPPKNGAPLRVGLAHTPGGGKGEAA